MEIICDKCRETVITPEWRTTRDGEIEYTYFTCPACGTAYLVSTTDSQLRRDIGKYKRMAARIRKGNCTESYHRRAQDLKERNIKRSRELATGHPLAPVLLQG